MKKRYAISISWSQEDAAFVATCREFPGVSAFGASYEAAAQEMDNALDAAMHACRVMGRELPAPITANVDNLALAAHTKEPVLP